MLFQKQGIYKIMTQIEFLTNLYKKDPLISNNDAFVQLKKQFPNTHTTRRRIVAWKYILRQRGIKIPLQRDIKKQN